VERDIGDILDRWSIAKLKSERIGTEENGKEYEAICTEMKHIGERYPEFDWQQISKYMYDINDNIWVLESGLKSGKESLTNPHYILDKANKESLANIGATTILIRNFNHLRVGFKNMINRLLGTGWQDIKKDHLSV
jgi:hypothetical protein